MNVPIVGNVVANHPATAFKVSLFSVKQGDKATSLAKTANNAKNSIF